MFMQRYAVVLIYLFTYRSPKRVLATTQKSTFLLITISIHIVAFKLSPGYLRAHSRFMN